MTATTLSAPTEAPPTSPLRWWQGLLVGVGAAVVGLLPWLITGMRLPLQNLWAADTAPDEMPRALLPLSQYAFVAMAALLLVGATVAAIVARATGRRRGGAGAWMILAGLLGVQLVATVQSLATVGAGLQGVAPSTPGWETTTGMESAFYLVVLGLFLLVSIVVGAAIFLLIARAPQAGALLGLAVAAVFVGQWIALLFLPGDAEIGMTTPVSAAIERWLPAVLVGAAIAWCGIRTPGRAIAAVASLLVLLGVPLLAEAVAFGAGTRAYAHDPFATAYLIVFFLSSRAGVEEFLLPVLVAVVVAGLGLLGRGLVGRGLLRSGS